VFRYRPGVPATTLPAARRFGETTRRDAWWVQSAVTFLGFTAFIIYSTWAGYSNANYEFGPYLSPMYSPLLFGPSPHSWFGGPAQPAWWPSFLHYSAAALILWGRSASADLLLLPRRLLQGVLGRSAGCAVGEPRKKYLGERWFPLVIQNIHRYFSTSRIVFIGSSLRRVVAMWWPAGGRRRQFGIGVATIVLTLNVFSRLLHVRLPLAAAHRGGVST
jgi:hypothetical protein